MSASGFVFEHLSWGSTEACGVGQQIEWGHYLHKMPDPRTSYETYQVWFRDDEVGALVFGRPEATRCGDWYGSVEDVAAGRCEVTRWQVLNLARVWIHPLYQMGGRRYDPQYLPGYTDRRGVWRSTLASDMLKASLPGIRWNYLEYRPPCFLDEPYELRWLLSYCDTRLHRGTIYQAAGFELHHTNRRGIQTWRMPLDPLTKIENDLVCYAAATNRRSIAYRARRAQGALPL